jgi:hypothetical protein
MSPGSSKVPGVTARRSPLTDSEQTAAAEPSQVAAAVCSGSLEVSKVTKQERFRLRLAKGGDVLAGSRLLAVRLAVAGQVREAA